MCDPSNPIAGGACPVKNTGPPPVVYPLMNAIKEPKQLGSSKEGSWRAIGKNINAIDYYIETLGTGSQYKGYGKRIAYDTGIKCSNMPGNAHKLADGTASGVGGYGLVPRMLGGMAGFVPTDLVSSAKDEIQCSKVFIHQNTADEIRNMNNRGTDGVPTSNKVAVSGSKGVNYSLMNQLCKQGRLRPCVELPVASEIVNEGFTVRRTSGNIGTGAGTDDMLMRVLYVLIAVGLLGGVGVIVLKNFKK
jgi:hypothetical protein